MAKITKDSILDCVWQLLEKKTPDKITVTEICEDCGINRNTFYYHFTDLIDVLDALLEREHDRFTESEKAKDILTDYNARVAFLIQHKKAAENIYHSDMRDHFTRYMNRLSSEFIRPYVEEAAKGKSLKKEDIDYICGFYQCALEGLIYRWMERDMPVVSGDVHERFAKSFYATIDGMINSIS
ncbi:MAG: TetR/AcrR family transcriptional regulator [Lachnospiraceae bacterium]|nr:TetR/AcrR family transcriptional regulator [Lachnospiraceae bacterium]